MRWRHDVLLTLKDFVMCVCDSGSSL